MSFRPLPGGGSYEEDWSQHYSPGEYGGAPLASVRARYASAALDYGFPVMLAFLPRFDLGLFSVLFLIWLNSGVVQGLTGQSLGKWVFGVKLGLIINDMSGQLMFVVPGVKVCSWRLIGHVQDLATLSYALATHVDRQSFADQRNSTIGLSDEVRLKPRPEHYATIQPR